MLARACVYSKHVTRLNLVKYDWGQGTEAAIVAHDTRKQEDAIRMNRQHVNQCVKEYPYTEFKCIIIGACEDAITDAHARLILYIFISNRSIWQSRTLGRAQHSSLWSHKVGKYNLVLVLLYVLCSME